MNVNAVPTRLTPQMVSASVRTLADNDGDGKTGAAALNDGDAAAHAATRQVIATQAPAAPAPPVVQHAAPQGQQVDVKA